MGFWKFDWERTTVHKGHWNSRSGIVEARTVGNFGKEARGGDTDLSVNTCKTWRLQKQIRNTKQTTEAKELVRHLEFRDLSNNVPVNGSSSQSIINRHIHPISLTPSLQRAHTCGPRSQCNPYRSIIFTLAHSSQGVQRQGAETGAGTCEQCAKIF